MARELFEDQQIRLALERGSAADAEFWRRVKADVDAAPPLSAEVRDKLSILLRPEPAPIPGRRAAQRAAVAPVQEAA